RLADLEQWSTYFGVPPKADFDAYDVGSAFLFFVEGKYGQDKLKALLVDLGRTRELAASARAVLGLSADETEAAWEQYLRAAGVHVPAVTLMVPADGEADVATDLREVRVTFDADMQPGICVITDCHDGLCYDHARWADPRTFVVAVVGSLLPAHDYILSLGVPGRCRLKDRHGVEAPTTPWRFRTR
ncbi:MAG TPA: Ig-like domain-containing protein, partial [Polyangiaceae bacterium]|nr:Ig-like domain-containing protein [Polyangiaceae bacterium]